MSIGNIGKARLRAENCGASKSELKLGLITYKSSKGNGIEEMGDDQTFL